MFDPSRIRPHLAIGAACFACVELLFAAGSALAPPGPVDVQDPGILRARLDRVSDAELVVLGDSVAYGGNLAEREGRAWHEHALPAALERATGKRTLNLGVNGVLYPDLACLARRVLERAPPELLVHVSPRPFSSDFADAATAVARPFLCEPLGPDHPIVRRSALRAAIGALPGTGWARRRSASEDAEEEEALARMLLEAKAAGRYASIHVQEDGAQARALRELIDALRSAPRTKSVLFYLEEDLDRLEGKLDRARAEEEERRFVELVASMVSGPVSFVRVSRADMAGLYDDHVHPTEEGYAKLAALLRPSL